jgi:hypothetical protein
MARAGVGKISFFMRHAALSGALCATVFVCVAAAVVAQDAAKGAALLAEARTAVGGDERLHAVKTLDVRGDFRRAAGQTIIEGQLQIRIELPDKLRRDEDLSPPGGGPPIIRTEVLNGTDVWEESSGRGRIFIGGFGQGGGGRRGGGGGAGGDPRGRAAVDPAQIEEAQRRAWRAELARLLFVWLLVADGPVAWVGTAEAPDGRADVLAITPAAGPVARLFLDQASHLPLMITWPGATPQLVIAGSTPGGGRAGDPAGGRRGGRGGDAARGGAAEATLQMTFAEYKTVNGIRLPHAITRGADNVTTEEWTIDSYRINPAFRADVFTR